MKRTYEAPPHSNEAESTKDTKRNTLRKLIAIGALSTIALTGCATNNAEAKDPAPTEQTDPAPTETEAPKQIENNVEKSGREWNLSTEGLVSLIDTYDAKGRDDPEFQAQYVQTCNELFANNLLETEVASSPDNTAEEVNAIYGARVQLLGDYFNDFLRGQIFDQPFDEKVENTYRAAKLCVNNYLDDPLEIGVEAYNKNLPDWEGNNNNPMPLITSEYGDGKYGNQWDDKRGEHYKWALTYSDVTVAPRIEGAEKRELSVMRTFRWVADPSTGAGAWALQIEKEATKHGGGDFTLYEPTKDGMGVSVDE